MNFIIGFLLLFFFSCSQVSKSPLPAPPTNDVSVGDVVIDAPVENKLIKVVIKELSYFSTIQGAEERFRRIANNTEKVINSENFKKLITEHKYQGKLLFVDTADTTEEVFTKITSQDWILEYKLEKLFSSKTIGYTYPNVTWIVFNSKKWNQLSDAEISANICHEYGGHKLGGYNHAAKWNQARDYSAPYGIGTACKTVYKQMFKQ